MVIFRKVVVNEQKWLSLGKVVFEREGWLYFGKSG